MRFGKLLFTGMLVSALAAAACNKRNSDGLVIEDVADEQAGSEAFVGQPHKPCQPHMASFFSWYAANSDNLLVAQDEIFGPLLSPDSLLSFNPKAAESYLRRIRSSNHFAPVFADSLERMIFQMAQKLPPRFTAAQLADLEGADAEFILKMQDNSAFVEALQDSTYGWEYTFLGADHWKVSGQLGSLSIRVDSTTCRIRSISWAD